jgi:hypothetical protein
VPPVTKVGNRVIYGVVHRYNTNVGNVCLINACLSSLPMFTMGFYLLLQGTHDGFDKHGGSFYWNDADNKHKYRLVKWKIMCRPKNLGGLGILNTSVMNKCLILKWWRRIMTSGPGTLWFLLLKAKYFPLGGPLFASASHGSQFWKDLVKVRDVFREHVKFFVGNGGSARFWLNWWSGDSTLAVSFPVLFLYCSNPEISISELSRNN